jgi:ABC-2 type transport system ATP-binding protein
MTVISARGLTKRFRGNVIGLEGVDLDIERGEAVAFLGPNGAGKTTLLRILATVILPDGGHAKVGGHDIRVDPLAVRRSIGVLLSEDRSWYLRLSGRANLEFFGVVYGLDRRTAADRASALLHDHGLGDAADRRVSGYSAGMRARLALARALLASPPILLLDEPTRSLDPMAAIDFRRRLGLLRQDQVTILFATHDLHEAASLADRVVVLDHGRMQAIKSATFTAGDIESELVGLLEQ